jgi:hypothetical protein
MGLSRECFLNQLICLATWRAVAWLRAKGLLLVGLAYLITSPCQAQSIRVERAPSPSWVEAVQPDLNVQLPADQTSQGQHFLLVDEQVRVEDKQRTNYRHYATRALSVQGLESLANLDIRFDPSYQTLTLHQITVLRGDERINKLASAKVRVLQRETELDTLIFDGSRSANVFLEDVRVGDVVEYAYSLRGHNPVFGQLQFGRFAFQWTVPVARVVMRLQWPQGRPVHMRAREGASLPAAASSSSAQGMQAYRWDLSNVAARRVDADAPGWFDPYPQVQWSEFKDWAAVVQWALPLYRLPEVQAAPVQAEIKRIAAAHSTPEARLLAALKFVQTEVRYLGVETGAGSHAPSPPALVLARRFGDCKDKTLLTLALLRGLGLQAHAALVHTSARQSIDDWQPSPSAFNHVLLRVRLPGGDMWLDPTRPPQHGSLKRIGQADFGLALVVVEDSKTLVPMADEATQLSKREIKAVLDSSAGLQAPAKYTVTTTAFGRAAESMRASLSAQTRDSLEKDYANFYAGYFGSVKTAAPMEVVDDKTNNQLTVTEHYLIDKLWQMSDTRKRLEASIEVPDVSALLTSPKTKMRTSPLALAHPVELLHITEVRLPGNWNLKPDRVRIDEPVFELQREEEWQGSTLRLTDRYRSRVSHVQAEGVPRYVEGLEKARQALGYRLHERTAGAAGSTNWAAVLAGALALGGSLWLVWRLSRWDPAQPTALALPVDAQPALTGLSGWLLLALLGMLARLFIVGRTLWKETLPALNLDTWWLVTSPDSASSHVLWGPTLLLGLVSQVVILVTGLLLLALFFQRRTSFPRLFIWCVWATMLAATIELALIQFIPNFPDADRAASWGEWIRGGLTSACWTAYFIKSRRVRLTFLYRLKPVAERGDGVKTVEPAPAT